MESIVKVLFDFDKLPSKLILIVAILSGIILMAPTEFLSKLHLEKINAEQGQWVGIAFLATVSFLFVTLITTIQKKIKSKNWNKNVEKTIRENLQSLDPVEQSVLREFFLVGSTINLPADEAQVVGLQDKHLIRLAQSNLGGSYFMSGMNLPFMLTGYARKVIEKNVQLIGLPQTTNGKITEEQIQQLANSRPPWVKNSWGY